MKWREALQRFRRRGKQEGASSLLKQLSAELRSDAVPAVLRDAARTVASLLDGERDSAALGGSAQGAVIVNVSVAVAVGAPGKEQGGGAEREGATPNDAVVVATAVASSPARSGAPVSSDGSTSDGSSSVGPSSAGSAAQDHTPDVVAASAANRP